MPPFHRACYRTTFIEKRAALLSLTSLFHTSFRAPSSASAGRASNTHELHAKTPAGGAAPSPASRKGRRRDLEEALPGGRALPRGAAGLGERLPRSLAAQPRSELGEQPRSRPPPGSPRSGTHRTEGALGSSSAPARRRPGRRRGREAP